MKINPYWHAVIVASALIISIAGYNLHSFLYDHFGFSGVFYKCMATFIALIMFSLHDLSRPFKTLNSVARIGLGLAANNLWDELFGDPGKFGLNEYIFAVLIVLYEILRGRTEVKNFKIFLINIFKQIKDWIWRHLRKITTS